MNFRARAPQFVQSDKVLEDFADVLQVIQLIPLFEFTDGNKFPGQVADQLIHEFYVLGNCLAADFESVLIADISIVGQQVIVDAKEDFIVFEFG